MKDQNYVRGLYISQLESSLQSNIKNELIHFYKKDLELNDEDIEVELELAMNSRLNDLEDTIDVNKILNQS